MRRRSMLSSSSRENHSAGRRSQETIWHHHAHDIGLLGIVFNDIRTGQMKCHNSGLRPSATRFFKKPQSFHRMGTSHRASVQLIGVNVNLFESRLLAKLNCNRNETLLEGSPAPSLGLPSSRRVADLKTPEAKSVTSAQRWLSPTISSNSPKNHINRPYPDSQVRDQRPTSSKQGRAKSD
ncbi:hypothetical protein BSAF29S_02529 [Bacillus safensis subsp. safensis]